MSLNIITIKLIKQMSLVNNKDNVYCFSPFEIKALCYLYRKGMVYKSLSAKR